MKDAILHGRMELGETELRASDVAPNQFQPMRSVYLSIGVCSDAEAERIYSLLAAGGEVFMPIQQTFFADRFGMLRDMSGSSWMILSERPSA